MAANLAKIPVIDPGKDVGHPHTVILIEAIMRAANPTVDLSSPGKRTQAVMQWQAILFNSWKVVGGPNDKAVTGKADSVTLTGIMAAAAQQDFAK